MPAPVAGENGNWACEACGNVNFATREVCNRCQAPKPAGAGGFEGMWGPPPAQFGGGGGKGGGSPWLA